MTVQLYSQPRPVNIRFIDLFAGIGGFRLAFESFGASCVFSSEWDSYARKTYEANFGDCPKGDITSIAESDIPPHDVLTAGFPCQPFSIAGVSKANALGRAHGFEHATQGTLFFDVCRIIAHHRPRAFLLENVRNLVSHDKDNTFRVILRTLEEELGYQIRAQIVDARRLVPQHRERIYIVGFREPSDFAFPPSPDLKHYGWLN
jgi:DNA (cytosine-5)-methyltransferase 1